MMAKKNTNARIKADDVNALMAKHNADARINETDAYALKAKQAAPTTIRAVRVVTTHNLQNILKTA